MIGNVIVGQSGGPTSVINSSLVGVYKTARDRGQKVYGMLHGIKGCWTDSMLTFLKRLRLILTSIC